jgi:hypothetical protein
VVVVLVAGAGGLGKTTLAVHVAHRLRTRFPDGQLYVNLRGASDQPATPADVLARFLRELAVDGAQVPASEDERAALYRTRLAGRRILVVLDDARDAAQARLGRPYGEVPAVRGSFSVRPPAEPDVPDFPASGSPVTYAVAAAGGRSAWIWS